MGTKPQITVGIPFYNEERYLADAVRSVLRQTVHELEVLLVDDGSTDGSLAIARSFTDARVSVISDGRRRHLPARLNEIVRRASAPLVARMDADDVSHPERLQRELALLDAEAGCDAVGTWAALVDAHDDVFAVVEAAPLPSSPAVVLKRGLIPHATMLARRSWLLAHPYDERLTRAEDRDLWCRTVASSRFAVVCEPLYVIRVSTDRERFAPDYLEAQRQNRTLLVRHGPSAVGVLGTARGLAGSFARSAVMRAAARSGFLPRLVRLRGRAPDAREQQLVVEALAAVRGGAAQRA